MRYLGSPYFPRLWFSPSLGIPDVHFVNCGNWADVPVWGLIKGPLHGITITWDHQWLHIRTNKDDMSHMRKVTNGHLGSEQNIDQPPNLR